MLNLFFLASRISDVAPLLNVTLSMSDSLT
ncbi:hypothetical protein OIU78_020411 [Salix suchowensis]|nr:hypothetical protein OIU78_020411 [Salix suchowensis]